MSASTDESGRRGAWRAIGCATAVCTAVFLLPFIYVWMSIAPSWSGWFYIAGLSLTWVGLLTSPWRTKRWRGVVRGGLSILLITALFRLVATTDAGAGMELVRVPGPHFVAQVGNRIATERDALMVGASFALMRQRSRGAFLDAMSREFQLMSSQQGTVPSPWFATYTGQQSADSFDMQVFDVDGADTAVVFLHGFGGNFTLFCWEVAQAAAKVNIATLCPSAGWLGQWWLEDARETIRTAMKSARERGYRRLFLAGLSNGGIGLGRHADEFAGDVVGFLFISGVGEDAQPVRRPTLVVHGVNDPNVSAVVAEQYAKGSIHADYVGIEGGHFILVEDPDAVRDAISEWLERQTRPSAE